MAKKNLFKSTSCPQFQLTELSCHGQEKNLEKCKYKVMPADCDDINAAAGVVCANHHHQSAILLGGNQSNEGDVMAMNQQLEFGPVCDDSFGYYEVCMYQIQLQYIPMQCI